MSNKIKFLSQIDLVKCLDMSSAIDAMKIAFSEFSKGNVVSPLRVNIPLDTKFSHALFMPVFFPAKRLIGLKSVIINSKNSSKGSPTVQAMYSVYDSETGKTIAQMDGECLTSMRTGAASGLATDLLSRKNAKVAAIFGAGIQGEKQIEGICSIRNLEKIYISDLSTEKMEKLIETLQPNIRAKLLILEDEINIQEADIICTASSSYFPVFKHSNLKRKVHINGIGSYRPDMCEIPSETIEQAKLYVDSREACLSEAGDIIQPINSGKITADNIFSEIGDVLNVSEERRNENDNITVFKSVGIAAQDIVAASVILENANKLNIGREINI